MTREERTKIASHVEIVVGIMTEIADKQLELRAAVEVAKDQGVDPKTLKKHAAEHLMESSKLEARIADEEQLDLFRQASGILKKKGIEQGETV